MTQQERLLLLAALTPLFDLASTTRGALHEAVRDLLTSIAGDATEPYKGRIFALRDSLFSPEEIEE